MSAKKLRRLIAEIRASERMAMPVTYDTLEVDFEARRVTFRGRTINVESTVISIPLLSTDRLVIVRDGDVA